MNDIEFQTPPEPPGAPGRKNLAADARRLVAHVRNDITIPYYTDVLRPMDDTLIARGMGRGIGLYDEITRDTHAYAVLTKRSHELVAREWIVDPASQEDEDLAAADFCREVLDDLPFDRICLDLLEATLKGYAVSEIVWTRDGRHIVPAQIVSHDQRRFVFDAEWRLRMLTREAMLAGVPLPDRKFIVHRFAAKGNDPYGRGLGSKLFWPVLFKREGVAFWMTFLEKYAAPTPVAKVPMGMLPGEQRELLNALEGLIHRGALTVPIGTELEYLEATRSAPASHEKWARYWDEQMSECVLGETLSTNIGSVGSQAAATVHTEAKSQLVDADGDLLSDTLKGQLLAWMVDYNYPGRPPPRVWRQRPKNEGEIAAARTAMAAADKARVEALNTIIVAASHIEDDATAREFVVSFDVVEGLEDRVIDALVSASRNLPEPDRTNAAASIVPAGDGAPAGNRVPVGGGNA